MGSSDVLFPLDNIIITRREGKGFTALPGFGYSVWQGLVAPAGTPAAVASRISGAVADIVRQPDVARRLADVGLEAVGSSPAEMGAVMRQDRERWGKVVRETGARAD